MTSAVVVSLRVVTVASLELDLEVFSGPFDLLLTLVLREEVDLLEVELADVVLTYLDFLEARCRPNTVLAVRPIRRNADR